MYMPKNVALQMRHSPHIVTTAPIAWATCLFRQLDNAAAGAREGWLVLDEDHEVNASARNGHQEGFPYYTYVGWETDQQEKEES